SAVIDRVADDLDGTKTGLLLADHRGHVIRRMTPDGSTARVLDHIELAPGFFYGEANVGTNAIGTAIAVRGPSVVDGNEHFADALTAMACAAMPVTDPVTGRVLGVVDLTCLAVDSSPLMLPLAKRAAWEIEQRLLEDTTVDERILRERFLRERRHSRGPLVSLNDRTMLVNGAASGIVADDDRAAIWERVAAQRVPVSTDLLLRSGRSVSLRSEPVLDGDRLVGALIRLDGPSGHELRATSNGETLQSAPLRWESLTDTERSVARLAAEGHTNRDIAARIFLSPHTVDFHLRHAFQK